MLAGQPGNLLPAFPSIPPTPFRKPRAKPIYKPHSKFTPEEDFRLRQLVAEHGDHSWRTLAKFMPNRNSRQCRERWLNYLNPARNIEPWTESEDALLEQAYETLGPRWVYMMRLFPSRTDAMIKNRFQLLKRRQSTMRGTEEGAFNTTTTFGSEEETPFLSETSAPEPEFEFVAEDIWSLEVPFEAPSFLGF
jgi:hypothetical protein